MLDPRGFGPQMYKGTILNHLYNSTLESSGRGPVCSQDYPQRGLLEA